MIQILLESLSAELDVLIRMAPRVIFALAVFVLAILFGKVMASGLGRVLDRGQLSATHKKFFRRIVAWIVALFGLSLALNLIGLQTAASGLLAGGGITAVILGFAFREIGENLLAGFLMAFSRPFDVDDVVQSGEFKGTVREIDMRHTHIRTADGRDVFLPNAQIVNSPLVNFTRDGLLRPSFTVGIDYANNARDACALLKNATRQVPGVVSDPPVSATIAGLESSWVQLEVGFWVNTFEQNVNLAEVRMAVMDECRRSLREAGFTVSAEVTTNVELAIRKPVDVRVTGSD